MSNGSITLHIRGGGVVVGVSVAVIETVLETEGDRDVVKDVEGRIPIVPKKL